MPLKMKADSVIIANLGLQPNGPVQKFFTSSCAKHMDKYIPRDEGNLRINKTIYSDRIVYESPYARYQYYGVRDDGTHKVENYTTPGTGPYWDKRMWSAEKEKVVEETQKFASRRF